MTATVLQFPKQTEYMSTPELAKYIRGVLKAKFPKTKFSVRSSQYTGGSSISVAWTDGPTQGYVDSLVKGLQGSSFDGMIDLKSSRNVVLNGKKVLTDYIFCNRSLSKAAMEKVVAAVGTYYHAPKEAWPTVLESSDGSAYLDHKQGNTSPIVSDRWERWWTWECLVGRAAGDRASVTGSV